MERESDGGRGNSRRGERKARRLHTAGGRRQPPGGGGGGGGVSNRERPLQGEGRVCDGQQMLTAGSRETSQNRGSEEIRDGEDLLGHSLLATAASASRVLSSSRYLQKSSGLLHPLLPLRRFARG